MTMPRLYLLGVLAALGAGCSAAGSNTGATGTGGGAGWMGGAGGSITVVSDAGVLLSQDANVGTKADSGRFEVLTPNLADAASFNWDTRSCVGCSGGAAGTAGGAGGSTGAASGGSTGAGGSVGSGGVSGSGGVPGTGGSTSRGGATGTGGSSSSGADAGPTSDAPRPSDALSADSSQPALDAGVLPRDAGPDGGAGPDTAVADLRPADVLPIDVVGRCVAQIESVLPVTDSIAQYPLVAGPSVQVVLRAKIVSGGPAGGASWSWQANRDGAPLSPVFGKQDLAAAAFPIASDGNYTFSAFDKNGACPSVSVQVYAVAANACKQCDNSVVVRAAPPPSADIPVQSGGLGLTGTSPFSQTPIVLDHGVPIQVAPNLGSGLLTSYVRISATNGDLSVDGLADPKTGGFDARLLAVGGDHRLILSYDVLVVPIDGTNGSTVAATAPQLFPSLTPDAINNTTFNLAGGIAVTGTTLNSAGQAVADVRVMLTNQDPNVVQVTKLIFSSVGRSDAQGKYLLHAQPGKYWVSISPPPGNGLPEAIVPTSVVLTGDTTIGFKWDTVSSSNLVLNVVDAAGLPSSGTHVRLNSAEAKPVGTLTLGSAGNPQTANGNIQVEGTTSGSGTVTFASLPDGMAYDALLVPATLGLSSATTVLSLTLPKGGATLPATLLAQGRINGQLVPGAVGTAAVDWSHVNVVAYDRSGDTPEAPVAVAVNTAGAFSVPVSPGRPYVVLAMPDGTSPLARTFVAPGLLQSSEFTVTQRVQSTMAWSSSVIDSAQVGVAGTAIQVFCSADWPGCVDSGIALAETTSGDGGVFQLALPDPATR